MKIAAIIIRNKRNHFGGEFGCVLDAFADAGYPADKVFILQEGETHEFSQTVIECKNFFDAAVVSAEAKALLRLVERYSVDFVLNAHSCEGAPALLAPSMGLSGVWLAMCIELCFRGLIFLIRLEKGNWMKKI